MDGVEIARRACDESDAGTLRSLLDEVVLGFDLMIRRIEAWRCGGDRNAGYAGQRTKPRQELVIETLAGIGVFIGRVRELEVRGPELSSGDEGVDSEPVKQAAYEDAGPRKQHEGERELKDNKDGGEPSATAAAEAARAFIQEVTEIGPGRTQRGQRAKEHRAQDAKSRKIAEHGVVGGELDPVRPNLDRGLIEPADSERGQAKAKDAADRTEKEAFEEHLPHHPPAGSTEGGTNSHLALSVKRAAQHHVGDVGAGDEEYESDRAQHQQEDEPDLPAVETLLEREHARASVFVIRILASEAAGDTVELGLGLT